MAETLGSEFTPQVINAAGRFGASKPPGPPLQPPGGGGTFDGMEEKVARLESDVEYIKRDIGEIKEFIKGSRSDLSDLKVIAAEQKIQISNLPRYLSLITIMTIGSGAVIGILTVLARLGILAPPH